MIQLTQQFDPDEWQRFVLQLLSLKYGADLIEVPDKDKGDTGIEAFEIQSGCAFQCYSPEEPFNVVELASKHKRKISRDIKKFRDNQTELQKILGETVIRRWILVVPLHCSKDVVEHCQKKTDEIRSLNPSLGYVSSDFQVLAVDGHNFFALEIGKLTSAGGLLAEAVSAAVSEAEVESFVEEHDQWIGNLHRKIQKLSRPKKERDALVGKLLRMHLEGNNAIDYYDGKYPVISDKIRSLKQTKAKALEIESQLQKLTIAATREKFETELIAAVTGLGKQTAIALSYACIAEWLMVCPLDPKG